MNPVQKAINECHCVWQPRVDLFSQVIASGKLFQALPHEVRARALFPG